MQSWSAHFELTVASEARGFLIKMAGASFKQVLVRNLITNVGRPARVVVLDPPEIQSTAKKSDQDETTCSVDNVSFFPSCTIPAKTGGALNPEVAYLSPPLAFNIGLHVSWLDMLIRRGSEEDSGEGQFLCSLEVHPLPKTSVSHHAVQKILHGLSQYAAHVRIAHIRTPALAANLSKQKDYRAAWKKDRQARIDAALAHYFECDRLLAEGDILSIRVPPPDSFLHASFGDVCTAQEELIHFKVRAIVIEVF